MLTTKAMTARRTEQFLKELQFRLDDIQRSMITSYARNGEIVTLGPAVTIRMDYRKDAKLPSEAEYVVEIYTEYEDYEQPF